MELKPNQVPLIFIISLTVIGAVLRFYRLDWQCLMTDEWHTWRFISSTALADCITNSIWYPDNSLYYPLAKLSSDLLGTISVYSIRLPSAIYGVLVIPIAYFVGKEYNNKITGILTSGFIALSFPFIYYSQNARSYMPVLLTFLLFTYFLIKIVRGETTRKNMILICISAILCLYAHQYAIIPLTLSCIAILYFQGKRIWKYLICAGLSTAPATVYNRNYIPVIFGNGSPADYGSPFWLSWDKLTAMIPSELFGQMWPAVFCLLAYSLYKKHDAVSICFTVVTLLTILSCLPMAFVLAMSPRYVLLVAPMLFLVAIDPVSDFIDSFTGNWKKSALIILCLFIFWACAYGPWLSWTTFNYCAYV